MVDSNSLIFLFKHAPDVAKELQTDLDLSFETANLSRQENWLVCCCRLEKSVTNRTLTFQFMMNFKKRLLNTK